jgi:preprotein translocase subunit SecG
MLIFLLVVHIIVCVALIFIVLIQTSKGGLESTFGGIATGMLGVQGANEFVKLWTKILFAAFVISCVLLASQVKKGNGSASGSGRSKLQEAVMPDLDQMEVLQGMEFEEAMEIEGVTFEE